MVDRYIQTEVDGPQFEREGDNDQLLPSIEDMPWNYRGTIETRSKRLEYYHRLIDTRLKQFQTIQDARNLIQAQRQIGLAVEVDKDEVDSRVRNLQQSLKQKADVINKATALMNAGKDASRILGVDDDMYRAHRTPRNLGDIWARIISYRDIRSKRASSSRRGPSRAERYAKQFKDKKTDFQRAQTSKVDDLTRELEGMIPSIDSTDAFFNQKMFDVDLSDTHLDNKIQEFVEKDDLNIALTKSQEHLTTISDLSLRIEQSPEFQDPRYDKLKKKLIEEREKAERRITYYKNLVDQSPIDIKRAMQQVSRDLEGLSNHLGNYSRVELTSGNSYRGSNYVVGSVTGYATITQGELGSLKNLCDKVTRLETMLNISTSSSNSNSTEINRIIEAAELLGNEAIRLVNNERVLTHSVPIEALSSVLESGVLGSRSYQMEKIGKAVFTMGALEVERNNDGTFTVRDIGNRTTSTVPNEYELSKVTPNGIGKSWYKEYHQLCFTADGSYEKMIERGAYFIFDLSQLIANSQFFDDDGLHLFSKGYNPNSNPEPFALKLSEIPFLIAIPDADWANTMQILNAMDESYFEAFGGKINFINTRLVQVTTVNQEIRNLNSRLHTQFEGQFPPIKKGHFVPSGVSAQLSMQNGDLLIYK